MSGVAITEPGVYYELPAADYHAQRDWLSWSMAKFLLPPNTPAHFKAALRRPRVNKRHFDLGHVTHTLVLGDGERFEVVQAMNRQKEPYPATSYDLVSAQRHRDEIYAAGGVPILQHELEAARAMAESVLAHPTASRLFVDGRPEVSLFWIDEATGVRCRCRLDFLPNPQPGRRLIVPDLKTSAQPVSASEFARVAAKFGYYGQQEFYRAGIAACGLDDDPAFLFVAVETADPYLVSVPQIADRDDVGLARATVERAVRLFATCTADDSWPGHSPGITDLSLPTWLHYQLEEFVSS